jgi:hypothetical protein
MNHANQLICGGVQAWSDKKILLQIDQKEGGLHQVV